MLSFFFKPYYLVLLYNLLLYSSISDWWSPDFNFIKRVSTKLHNSFANSTTLKSRPVICFKEQDL